MKVESRKMTGAIVVGLFGTFVLGMANAGPCESQREALKAKKGACHGLPKEQRAACKAEHEQMKAALESCKAQAKASKASKAK